MCDFSAEISLYESQAGGRKEPTPPEQWGCLLGVEGEYFDCRLILDGQPLVPGERRRVWVKLLDAQASLQRFSPGREFVIFDGRIVGTGTVI